MFGKDWDTRWTETINYLNSVTTTGNVGTHIQSIVTTDAKRKAISKELSLGGRPDGEDDPAFVANTSKRHALRALLMCQRVYYSGDTWARQSEGIGNMETVGLNPVTYLESDWKTVSLNHWKTKSEADIQQGIKMFELNPAARSIDLQQAAYTGEPNGTPLAPNLKVSRADTDTVGSGIICYVGVQGWLVRSGLVSLRWFHQNSAPNGKIGCDLLFGQGVLVWDKPILDSDLAEARRVCRSVPAGHIVHMWSPANSNWNGHWLVANGDGSACGVNNGEVDAAVAENRMDVQKNYTKTTTLFEQFVTYSKAFTVESTGEQKRTKACMAVIDPMQMPRI